MIEQIFPQACFLIRSVAYASMTLPIWTGLTIPPVARVQRELNMGVGRHPRRSREVDLIAHPAAIGGPFHHAMPNLQSVHTRRNPWTTPQGGTPRH